MNLLRHAVSKQKRRFIDRDSGLDLDLAYITPSLIAMGYPSRSLEAFYRNPMSEVEKFLDSRHKAAYKVYNLCSERERTYSEQRFHGRVAQFPFPDHSPPPFQLIHPFCEDVSDWLHTTTGNVVAVHCKAGKGRTGVMICAFLVHCGATAEEAIKLYGEKRTHDGCGVTIPSQVRYIHYYEQFLESRTLNYDPRLLTLREIVIDTVPKPLQNLEKGSNYVILTIMSSDVKIYESMPQHCYVDTELQQMRISITDKIVLAGDVKMTLWFDTLYKRSHLCHFCFNTTFIGSNENSLNLKKHEVDKACKDKLHSIFDKDFAIRVHFSPALAQQSPLPTLDSLPNRAILLKYKNHEGPNSVQISPPYFSTRKLSPARNTSAMEAFGIEIRDNATASINTEESNGTTAVYSPSSSTPNPLMNGKLMHSPVVVHTSKPAFKPVWSDKDRDRDDNWDTASISSDISESDSSLEWWYTKPPRPTTAYSITATAPSSNNEIQSESGVKSDKETTAQNLVESQVTKPASPPSSPLAMFFPISSTGQGGHTAYRAVVSGCSSILGVGSGAVAASPPASVYKTPPHSASSPLAREIKFDVEATTITENSLRIDAITLNDSQGHKTKVCRDTEQAPQLKCDLPSSPKDDSWGKDIIAALYLQTQLETNGTRHSDSNCGNHSSDIESPTTGDPHECERAGWVDSVSRWLWSADGKGPQSVADNSSHGV